MGNAPSMMIDPDGMRFMLSGATPVVDREMSQELANMYARHAADLFGYGRGDEWGQSGGVGGGGGGISSMLGNWSGGASGRMGNALFNNYLKSAKLIFGNPNFHYLASNDPDLPVLKDAIIYSEPKLKRSLKKVWNWIKGIKFHFSLGGKVTIGAEVGLEAKIKGRNIGFDANLTAVELVSGNVDITASGNDGFKGVPSGSMMDENGQSKVTQGISGGIGFVSGEIEREFEGGKSNSNDHIKIKGSAAVISAEQNIPLSQDAKQRSDAYQRGAHMDIAAKAALLLGIEIRIKIGISHD